MQVLQSNSFARVVKKLHSDQKIALDEAVRTILSDPLIGEAKIGDLAMVRVYKFRMINQLTLLAYLYNEQTPSITLLALGSHQNFYRDLKNQVR